MTLTFRSMKLLLLLFLCLLPVAVFSQDDGQQEEDLLAATTNTTTLSPSAAPMVLTASPTARLAPPNKPMSPSNTAQSFLFGVAVLFTVFLLVWYNRQHDSELQELRQLQQQRRQQQQVSDEEDRNAKLVDNFHCTTIPTTENDGSKPFTSKDMYSMKRASNNNKNGVDTNLQTAATEESQDIEQGELEPAPIHTTPSSPLPEVETEESVVPENSKHQQQHQSHHFFAFWNKRKEECSICLDKYRPGDTICVAKVKGCDHIFHHDCISEWLQSANHDHCPLCRTNLMR